MTIPIHDFDYFRTTGIHRHMIVWPERYVVCNTPVGWNACELCGTEHRVWMTLASTWTRLPRRLHDRMLCVRCFRKHARRPGQRRA